MIASLCTVMWTSSTHARESTPAQKSMPAQETVRVGSKRFTESYILGEILADTIAPVARAEHRRGLGNTAIVVEALRTGAIDVYVDYTGTLARDVLKTSDVGDLASIDRALSERGLGASVPLGFQNRYALAMRDEQAARLGIARIGDLAARPELRFGLSHEFLGRADGWPGLARAYGLPQRPTGLDHGLAYQALSAQRLDVIDAYTTDAEIERDRLRVLDDERAYFPRYDAVLVYRRDLPQRAPRAWRALRTLEGRIDTAAMIRLNAQAAIERRSFETIAREFVERMNGGHPNAAPPSATNASAPAVSIDADASTESPGFARAVFAKTFDAQFLRLTVEHVRLVAIALACASFIGIALGVFAAKTPSVRRVVLAVVGVLQTVPSLALLALLIPIVGRIGAVPALIALFVYALLPIVRNTCVGLLEVPEGLHAAALALGLNARDRLRFIALPIAAPTIAAGIKTAAVTSVGTATIAAFIGAGGYGERIATGLAVNDHALLWAGALPAAALALIVEFAFDASGRSRRRRRAAANPS